MEGSEMGTGTVTYGPVLWTNIGTRILAAFNFGGSIWAKTIYEFDASTLKILGAPFKGHTQNVNGLAISSDSALLASASHDGIKLWAFESRQLLASFHDINAVTHLLLTAVTNANIVVFSPDTQQLAYTTYNRVHNLYICDIPPNIRASIGLATKGHLTETSATVEDLLGSDAPSRSRRPATPHFIYCAPNLPIPLPTRDPQQHVFLLHLRKFFRSSFPMEAVAPVLHEHHRDRLDIPATSRLHPIHSPSEAATQGRSYVGPRENHILAPIVDVPHAQGKQRNAAAGAPKQHDEDQPLQRRPTLETMAVAGFVSASSHSADILDYYSRSHCAIDWT
ncbi:hypothetical protein K503DRAFT_865683 [Rhizopogon vinicolor AM-OR11-026]|uniref:Uncharacterized protein n=1 Tax=Rhizopogon vinicolor AM-OR11-026 TaxID=1314800 RepID=A0A1B7N2N0_9AGAM|nr:hypothetical protein K503DRAFT_865683 [Rhizopogon vinicolor AM-OR11-026]